MSNNNKNVSQQNRLAFFPQIYYYQFFRKIFLKKNSKIIQIAKHFVNKEKCCQISKCSV